MPLRCEQSVRHWDCRAIHLDLVDAKLGFVILLHDINQRFFDKMRRPEKSEQAVDYNQGDDSRKEGVTFDAAG